MLVLPYTSPLPSKGPWRPMARILRLAAYLVVIGALLAASALQIWKTREKLAVGRQADDQYLMALVLLQQAQAQQQAEPSDQNQRALHAASDAAQQAAWGVRNADRAQGAILYWTPAVRQMWEGRNIYLPVQDHGGSDPLTGRPLAEQGPVRSPLVGLSPEELTETIPWPHPNMPFVVILLTPLSKLPPLTEAVAVIVLQLAALGAAVYWACWAVNHDGRKMADWVLGLALVFAMPLVIADIQQGNTNTFVLAALAGHLFLYRRGQDQWAGAALALAICFKLTPLLFALYWLYQRNWKLLGGLVIALAAMVVLTPLVLLGWARYIILTDGWLRYVGGYLDAAYLSADGFNVLLAAKLAGLVLLAWAIGWRRLSRDDGRRGLHYALVLAAVLLLTGQTRLESAAPMLVAYLAVWYALACGRLPAWMRLGAMAIVLAGGVPLYAMVIAGFAPIAGQSAEGLSKVLAAGGSATFKWLMAFLAAAFILLEGLGRQDEPYTSRAM